MTEASRLRPIVPEPLRSSYDVVVIGGAVMGSSVAWFLSANPDFDGSVLVVERDGSYDFSSTPRTNSCIRQQFSTDLNWIDISRLRQPIATWKRIPGSL